jgi:hypothetical protein
MRLELYFYVIIWIGRLYLEIRRMQSEQGELEGTEEVAVTVSLLVEDVNREELDAAVGQAGHQDVLDGLHCLPDEQLELQVLQITWHRTRHLEGHDVTDSANTGFGTGLGLRVCCRGGLSRTFGLLGIHDLFVAEVDGGVLCGL